MEGLELGKELMTGGESKDISQVDRCPSRRRGKCRRRRSPSNAICDLRHSRPIWTIIAGMPALVVGIFIQIDEIPFCHSPYREIARAARIF
ncbi:Hypothetical protein NTJ_16100 [Nesidiocoris tenuis]|uniref:Uncharacterized protein n=1 Tax=Nesidiocoris tenuis TaxID=355587 RepID=A0ABN7BFZ1_9HEMI|nr:Hypothetical protein NTJ_16100 [Nesidiocoris tenuis]